ncbi:MAG TPA: DNA topoisomerase I [Candidatus Acidoferrales bacterium]|nr:DNA topoisomerase I [Candidatus Acidoferrales bacterium]
MATTLIITEKPDAAFHVAEALCEEDPPEPFTVNGVPFFNVSRTNERILVCSALGHLYAVAARNSQSRAQYPVWDYYWAPKHIVERGKKRLERWIQAIEKVSKEATRFVNACDYDVEGSLIGYTILKYACHGADDHAQRMKFSTLTARELRESYRKAFQRLDFSLAFAGMCRHEVDWLYGINLSRALTQSALKASKRYTTLSTGRVQGPTLKFVVDREREIQTFIPTPFWALKTRLNVDGQIVEAEYESDRIVTKAEAEQVVRECTGKVGVITKLDSNLYTIAPPTPFDLSELQSEAYRHLGYSPRFALSIAERLYLDQVISYPRTSSQKLPPSIGYEEIMKNLSKSPTYHSDIHGLLQAGSLMPNAGRKVDPAHPAIYPTGILPKQNAQSQEHRLFDLIVRRFLATFGKPATKQASKATVQIGKYTFYLRGSRVIAEGWIPLYGPYAKFEEKNLPRMKEGQEVEVEYISQEEKFTQPPPRFNPSSLLREMERAEIGTKATRAEIIETLYRRGYFKDQRIVATPLAFQVTDILTKYCPKVLDVTFTRELEERMGRIESGEETRERVILETVDYLKPVFNDLKAKEEDIGAELTSIVVDAWLGSVTLTIPCPSCGSALRIVKNPRTKKRFIGCTAKWKSNCAFSLPLPQIGTLKLLNKHCPECAFQLIQVRRKSRPPFTSCPNCYVRKIKVKELSPPVISPTNE